MDFPTLKQIVSAQYDSTHLNFNFSADSYGSDAINTLLRTPNLIANWQLTEVSAYNPDDTNEIITLTGLCTSLFSYTNVSVTMVFFLSQGNAQLLIKLNLGSDWHFTQTFPCLANSVFEEVGFDTANQNPLYVFASSPYEDKTLENGSFATGLNFYAKMSPAGDTFTNLVNMIGSFNDTTINGLLSINTQNQPSMALQFGFQSSLTDKFPLLKNAVQIALLSQFDSAKGKITGIWLSTTFDFGNQQGLTVGTILNPWTSDTLVFLTDFQNINFPLPSPIQFAKDFTDLIGANDLLQGFPTHYQNIATDLALQNITLGLNTTTWKPNFVSLTIGTPESDPGWSLEGLATISKATLSVAVSDPFDSSTRSVQVTISGDMSLPLPNDPFAMRVTGTTVSSSQSESVYEISAQSDVNSVLKLNLGDLMNQYLSGALSVPNIALGDLYIDYRTQSPKAHYAFYAALDPAQPMVFQLGGEKVLQLSDGYLQYENDSNAGSPGASVGGTLEFFTFTTQFAYNMPGDFKLTAQIPEFSIDISALAAGLIGSAWCAPSWFPTISLPQTSLYLAYQEAVSSYTFALYAEPSFGTIVTQIQKINNQWGIAVGLLLKNPTIAAFDTLSFLSWMDKLFSAKELTFVFASADMPTGFQFPLTNTFPQNPGQNVSFPNWAGALKGGFYFYGDMQLNLTDSSYLGLFQSMFSLPATQEFTLSVFLGENPEQKASVQAGFPGGSITIAGKTFANFSGYMGACLEDGEPSIYLEGVISTNISDSNGVQNLNSGVAGALSFQLTENAAFLAASITGTIKFGPIQLSNLAIVVGIDAEEIPSLGFATQIDTTIYGTTYDSSIAFFFDSGDPGKSLFAGSISNITLGQVFDTIVGVVSDGNKLPSWMDSLFDDVSLSGTHQFSIPATNATALQSRDFATISAAFNTASTTVSFASTTTLLVRGSDIGKSGAWFITDYSTTNIITHYQLATNGNNIDVSLEAQFYYCLPPGGGNVTLGPPGHGIVFNAGASISGMLKIFMLELEVMLSINPNQGILADASLVKPIVIIDNYIELENAQSSDQGPHFSLATYSNNGVSPHLSLDGKIVFLDLEVATTINIDNTGLQLSFTEQVGTDSIGASISVQSVISKTQGFSLDFSGEVHLNVPSIPMPTSSMGSLDLDTTIAVNLEFGENNGFYLKTKDAEFSFAGQSFTIPGFNLTLGTDKLSDLPGLIYNEVKTLIWDFLSDPEHWLLWVGKNIIQGVQDIENVLDNVFHAICSVWGNEELVVVAVQESFSASNSGAVAVTPSTPTPGVTQDMINSAQTWGQQTLENLVATAVIAQIQKTPPAGIEDFKINVVQNIQESLSWNENSISVMVCDGTLPTLTSLGYNNPFSDARFYNSAVSTPTNHSFMLNLSVYGDFNTIIQNVKVAIKYNNQTLPAYIFSSAAISHSFQASWDLASKDCYEFQYTVTYLNSDTPTISPWLNGRGTSMDLIVPTAAPQPVMVGQAALEEDALV